MNGDKMKYKVRAVVVEYIDLEHKPTQKKLKEVSEETKEMISKELETKKENVESVTIKPVEE